ncbi:hypothetical protein K9K83_05605 [Candidatus Woesearchaeota archaeon]|nr:hypothetical protein [Candidatus Woesearchaeota archaeon]
MEFCPKCGSMLRLSKSVDMQIMICSCGYEQFPRVSESKETINNDKEEVLGVASDIHPLAVYDHICSKCGFGKAQLISKGIWYSDEDEIQEFVCGKCGSHDRTDGIRGK